MQEENYILKLYMTYETSIINKSFSISELFMYFDMLYIQWHHLENKGSTE